MLSKNLLKVKLNISKVGQYFMVHNAPTRLRIQTGATLPDFRNPTYFLIIFQ